MSTKTIILSLDGGGIRGTIECAFLRRLETDLDKSLYDSFQMFAGTSTGGLIALTIAATQANAETCLKTYAPDSSRVIFDASIFDEILPVQTQPKYNGKGKRKILRKLYGQKKLLNVKKDVLITAYDIVNRQSVVFKSFGGSDSDYNPTLVEVGDATSAAPTFFPTVKSTSTPNRWLTDGGLAANDPSMSALTEAIRRGHKLEDIRLLSLGTGIPTRDKYRPDELGKKSQGWGGLGWLANGLIDHLFSGNTSMAAYQCKQLLGDRFVKVNGPLDNVNDDMDDTSGGNYKNMIELGESWYEQNRNQVLALFND